MEVRSDVKTEYGIRQVQHAGFGTNSWEVYSKSTGRKVGHSCANRGEALHQVKLLKVTGVPSSKQRNPSWPSAELLPVIVEFRDAHGSFLSSRKMGRAVASTVKEAKTAYSLWCASTGNAQELITDVVEKTSSAKGHPYGWVVIVEQGAAARRNPHCNPASLHGMVISRKKSRETPYEHAVRHADDQKTEPATIEPFVAVNRYGKVFLSQAGVDMNLSSADRDVIAGLFNRKRPAKRNPRPARATVRQKVRRNPSVEVHGSRGHDRLEMAEHARKSGRTFWAVVYAAQAHSDLEDAGYHKDADKALRMVHTLTGL